VKLLFDENLSPRLPGLLREEFPGSSHARDLGLLGATDSQVWDHARGNGFVIVSKDNDFRQRSFLDGGPPKVIWLSVGNVGTLAIADLLREQHARIGAFETDIESSLLIVELDDGEDGGR
jgi:predicted nuclease of predicted toxin-antitoxin system